ncbi:uncharacterized protein LOC121516049 isoform X2 [Cheilinus undulatus]|uniref:uncharacterized protein LOC121516049 isoform X2 n=1 Tax=Cheilinus undulatus TaxID=241271 RepID=UPI001BD406E1|nr:uncharacterized protein LOC121516049 isoform X2 [Cheilinus undulatus]
MWCYQKPGFEALLLAELQRQQQCNQFCDTLLKTEGVSVPAHSCILSAISPQISSSLSAMPMPPTGQSRLLEFHTLGTCTLLHLVRLLYSGQMAGEGEEERQEAVSAAARLGIHGLVEVTRGRNEEEEEGQHREVGVQTEPLTNEENEEGRGWWRREERDGDTFLCQERVSGSVKATWTLTEKLQVDTAPLSQPAACFETIDMGALQMLEQTNPHLVSSQIPYIPVSLVYQQDENQSQVTPSAGHCWPGATAEDLDDRQLEQFQGNVSGYINYFLNPDKEGGSRRGQPRGRPRGGRAAGTRAGTSERGTRRPRARTVGKRAGRGALMQTVDVQSVGVGKIQKMFLQRWRFRTPRSGQGGGAIGRRLCVKTRELLQPTKSYQRRRRCGKEWEKNQVGEGSMQQSNQDSLPVRPVQRAKQTTPASFSSPPVSFYDAHHALSTPLHPSPSPGLTSPPASYISAAPSLLHTTCLPPPAPAPNEPEHIDHLLEEVMMGLDILPNDNGDNSSSQNRGSTNVPLVAGSTQVVGKGGGVSSSSEPVLQQQGEGEINDMLENFLQSFEQHVDSCSTMEDVERRSQSSTKAILSKYRKSQSDEAGIRQSCSQLHKSPSIPQKQAEEIAKPVRKRPKKWGKNQYQFSLEKKRVKVRKTASSNEERDKQLQQIPVVKLERSGKLPVRVSLQRRGSHSPGAESPSQTKSTSSSLKYPLGSWSTKVYPIRSRLREARIMDSLPFLYEPLTDQQPPSADQPATREAEEVHLGSAGSSEEDKDEDIDVIGGSSPVPAPIIISWSGGEEEEADEDVDVVGEKMDYAPSKLFTSLKNGELENVGLR